jgi:hypothetical protein
MNLADVRYPRWYRQQSDPAQHGCEPPPFLMAFRQEKTVVTQRLHQLPSSLHQRLLQTR